MTLIKKTIILLGLLGCFNLSAQTNKNEISLHFGKTKGLSKDLNFSPLNYQLNGYVLNLGYQRYFKDNKSILTAQFDFEKNKLKSEALLDVPTDNLIWALNVAYLKTVKEFQNDLSFSVGGELQTRFNYWTFLENYSYSFLIPHSLNLKVGLGYEINEKQNLTATLSLPVLTLLVRPAYGGFNEEQDASLERPLKFITNGEFTSLNKYRAFTGNINYSYAINEKWDLGVNYQMNFEKTIEKQQFINWEQQAKISITRKF